VLGIFDRVWFIPLSPYDAEVVIITSYLIKLLLILRKVEPNSRDASSDAYMLASTTCASKALEETRLATGDGRKGMKMTWHLLRLALCFSSRTMVTRPIQTKAVSAKNVWLE
jgi:hypothetical protein